MQRRTFLTFLGKASVVGLLPQSLVQQALACNEIQFDIPFVPVDSKDELQLAQGLRYHIIAKWQDKLSDNEHYGTHNDFITYVKNNGKKNDLLLWVNHEYLSPMLMNHAEKSKKTIEEVRAEQYEVGGSIFRIKQNKKKEWKLVYNDPLNRRITGKTKIDFAWKQPIDGALFAEGTLANCAGGITPWGTFITCEENYDIFYGEKSRKGSSTQYSDEPSTYGWERHLNQNSPHHYGWVVEIEPKTGNARKHIALGRMAHEACTIHRCADGTIIAYTGDDSNDQCLYKYISNKPDTLSDGKLYVANITEGKWISMQYEEQSILQQNFTDQTDVLIHAREAAHLLGGSKLARPEDIEIDPLNGNVLIALTNNKPKGDYYGSILKIIEHDKDKRGLTFTAETFLTGGEETAFVCPDNMEFDRQGNLWFTMDVSGIDMPKPQYKRFGNNALFFVPRSGKQAGNVFRIANAPIEAEFTGPKLSPDGKTLFLCVQHPGEFSRDINNLTSHFPEGGNSIPKSCLVAIQGDLLDKLAT